MVAFQTSGDLAWVVIPEQRALNRVAENAYVSPRSTEMPSNF